jgi:hypothetical protein
MQRFERDPQSELVRRYARILRSAPAEGARFATGGRVLRADAGQAAAPDRTPAQTERAPSKT